LQERAKQYSSVVLPCPEGTQITKTKIGEEGECGRRVKRGRGWV